MKNKNISPSVSKSFLVALLFGLCLSKPLTAWPQSAAPLEIVRLNPNVSRLGWQSEQFSRYQLQFSPDLTTPWMNLGTLVAGDGTMKYMQYTHPQTLNFYRFKENAVRYGFNQNRIFATDDDSKYVELDFTLNFFGKSYTSLNANNNGNITFYSSSSNFIPSTLASVRIPIISPFWCDVDTRMGNPGLPTRLCKEATYGTGIVDGKQAFGINWVDVGYFDAGYDKLNSFQLILIESPPPALSGDFDIEFNYNKIAWEAGDASGGTNGLGGLAGRAGFSNGSDRTLELRDSGRPGYFLDSSTTTGLIYGSRNSTKPGRYIFQMRSGSVLGALNVFAGTDFVLPTTSTTTAALNGTATDPNNPSTLLPVSWSVLKALGTGTITFSNVNIRNPTVNIPLGIYETILQFTASSLTDSGITAADAIKINRYS